ncbi:NAD(P)-dependent oxidoreductase [Vicingaceae bacterium]|nr:NAD(P)-dependent oxidoreductase [Vicingaceae bacterium]
MKKILLTGSNGLLGQKIVHNIISKRSDEYLLLATSKGANRISKESGYTYQTLDISDVAEVNAIVESFRPDVIINTAAMTNVDECEDKKELCRLLNVEAVINLINASRSVDAHLIHLSTDFIFDGENGPYKEGDTPNPLSYYGQSKYDAERLLQESDIAWSIVRTIIVYGIGEQMSRTNIVLWAKEALEKGQPLTIVNDQFRSPTLAEDLAEGCLLIADQQKRGVYHLSGKDIMSIIELVKRVADYFELPSSQVSETSSSTLIQSAKRPPKTGFILDKAINDLGYKPHSFEEGLQLLEEQLKA